MLSRYKRFGKFTYFDIRNTKDDVVIEDGVSKDNQKFVTVIAVIFNDENSKNEQNVLFYKLL